jgi:c-di-GMP-binding flagellar brake protein YcgR
MERADRRRYFRINDVVGLSYQVIDAHQQQDRQRNAENVRITSIDLLRSIDREITTALNGLWQNNPSAANAIGLLNKKIDILATEMELDYDHLNGIEPKTRKVNISACGIAFECKDRFDIGQLLMLTIMLRPVNSHVKVEGRVIGCEASDDPENPHFRLRVDFDRVNLNVQEQLIQHIVRRQSSQLGSQRDEEP